MAGKEISRKEAVDMRTHGSVGSMAGWLSGLRHHRRCLVQTADGAVYCHHRGKARDEYAAYAQRKFSHVNTSGGNVSGNSWVTAGTRSSNHNLSFARCSSALCARHVEASAVISPLSNRTGTLYVEGMEQK